MELHILLLVNLCLGAVVFSQEEGGGEEEGPPEPPKEKCQHEFYDITATAESPEYPNNYPDSTNCVYRVLTNRFINVVFKSFSLEESQNCRYDYLQVLFEASNQNATPSRYCGDGLQKIEGGTLRGQGPLIMAFISDESDNMQGFKFTYKLEINGPDPCLSEPCQQGGNCSTYPGYYVCSCPSGYAGVNCEINKDDCLSLPCLNNGKCIDGVNNYTCECLNDFKGERCEITPDKCESEPCENGGLCVDRGVDFVCSCPRDFMGSRCEDAIPTPPPKETPTTVQPTTVPLETTKKPDDSQTGDGEAPTTPANKDNDDDNVDKEKPTDSGSNSAVVAIIVVFLLIALVLLAALFWYWWFHKRTKQKNPKKESKEEKMTHEVTLINMKTKSERDEDKNGKRLSRTTSINSITMKGKSDGNDQLIKKLKKVSEDILMEEVTDDALSASTIPQHHTTIDSPKANKQFAPLNGNPAAIDPPLKRISIPITQNELNKMASENKALKSPYGSETHAKVRNSEEYNISPEAAVNLFNQLQQSKGTDFDYRSALEQYKPQDFTKKPFPSATTFNPYISPTAPPKQLMPPPQNNQIFQPPNVPFMDSPTFNNNQGPYSNQPFNRKDADAPDDEVTELSPEEAADVVNHFLHKDPKQGDSISSREAMDIIRQVRRQREESNQPPFDREKSVVVHPREVASLINNFRGPHQYSHPVERGNRSILPSNDDVSSPAESEGRAGFRPNRDFREFSPIQEESAVNDEPSKQTANKQKRPSDSTGIQGEVQEEPNNKRLKKKARRFTSARTLDPDEKVHDWLKNTLKQKTNKYKSPSSPAESIDEETHTLTRPLPGHSNKETESPKPPNRTDDEPLNNTSETDVHPRTIRQTRRHISDPHNAIPITENKAKSLVEKLVRAPARSNKNVVGPGLGVSRENAFVGEAF